MNKTIDGLMEAQVALSQRPVAEILSVLARVTDRWLDRDDPIRRTAEERIAARTGLAPAMLRRGLDEIIQRLRGIPALLDQDLGSRDALDRFVRRAPGMLSRAWGPGLLVCIFAGNVPGIPAFDMALALALKSACLARPAREEPEFATLFAQSVAEVDPAMGRCLAVSRWDYAESFPVALAGAVLAYGSDESLMEIRSRVPAGVNFRGHGHKLSFAVVGREAATPHTAHRLALDVAMYDQQGCVSPHVAFVERGGELAPADFARVCGEALDALETEMPRARLALGEAMAMRSVCDEAEFTADAFFHSKDTLAWAVVHRETPAFLSSPLNRLLRTYAVEDLGAVPPAVAPYASFLQTVAFAGSDDRREALGEILGNLGATRICPIGQVQDLSPLLRHDGRPTAGDLVRWTDIEG